MPKSSPQPQLPLMNLEGSKDDIVIPIMGPTGVGKSTFISNVLAHLGSPQHIPTSDGFQSCTSTLAAYSAALPPHVTQQYSLAEGRRLVLLDTPGFDNTQTSDTEILRRIAQWLTVSYNADMKVGGIVYIYPIYPGRITRSDCANIKIFRKICGPGGLEKVILATTRWDICPKDTADSREREISANFWSDKSHPGPRNPEMARLGSSAESAWGVVSTILERMEKEGVVLALQRQLVDRGQILQQTDAARELRAKIMQLLEDADPRTGDSGRRQRIDTLAREAKELKIPLTKRIQSFFGQVSSRGVR
ncbi:P-loop containing nucleoside triphosphate hydrolase protein [Ephemerocybe angulata]|uniref:P-loop containing nucleoside triphosphate hydrolase protein n=2 Tax=Ephemerocybe angulata TaxID=980116 RepID=A0A8H6HS77_9AGAR|nr:P-loop containing nucleoside triphosphate hydrolase protein [Tulosesus angulatus]KAF6751407.1 P-loop containing nucleoside triphosphate hydrolase protein [Tulosesus angulatus]